MFGIILKMLITIAVFYATDRYIRKSKTIEENDLVQFEFKQNPTLKSTTERPFKLNKCGNKKFCVPKEFCQNQTPEETINDTYQIDFGDSDDGCEYMEKCCEAENMDVPDIQQRIKQHKSLIYRNCSFQADYEQRHRESNQLETVSLPWVVSIIQKSIYIDGVSYLCSGSLISASFVLTAASCFDLVLDMFGSLYVRAGEFGVDAKKDQQNIQDNAIKEKIKHEEHTFIMSDMDIALLLLQKPFTLNDNVQPVCLPPPNTDYDEFGLCQIAGHARHELSYDFGLERENKKKRYTLEILPEARCYIPFLLGAHNKNKFLLNNTICIGKKKQQDQKEDGQCYGDLGSSVVCRLGQTLNFYQVGIAKKSIECGGFAVDNIATKVEYFRQWIDEQLRKKNYTI